MPGENEHILTPQDLQKIESIYETREMANLDLITFNFLDIPISAADVQKAELLCFIVKQRLREKGYEPLEIENNFDLENLDMPDKNLSVFCSITKPLFMADARGFALELGELTQEQINKYAEQKYKQDKLDEISTHLQDQVYINYGIVIERYSEGDKEVLNQIGEKLEQLPGKIFSLEKNELDALSQIVNRLWDPGDARQSMQYQDSLMQDASFEKDFDSALEGLLKMLDEDIKNAVPMPDITNYKKAPKLVKV
jgi:hypothetical protein